MSESEEEYEYDSEEDEIEMEDEYAQQEASELEGHQGGDASASRGPAASAQGAPLSPPMKRTASTVCKDGEVRLLDAADLVVLMQSKVAQLSDLFDIPPAKAAALLRATNWSQEKLTDRYWSDPDGLTTEVGVHSWTASSAPSDVGTAMLLDDGLDSWLAVANPQAASSQQPPRAPESQRGTVNLTLGLPQGYPGIAVPAAKGPVTCRICFCEPPPQEAVAAPCGHFFCAECYQEYLATKLSEGPAVVFATCPEHKCACLVPPELWSRALSGHEQGRHFAARLSKMALNQFVGHNRQMRWCPAPGCSKVIMAGVGVANVRCHPGGCGCAFCFKCGEEAHQPASCQDYVKWTEKCQNESETANWILANTKRCPKCNTRIEKNQGCNHMTCSQCKHEFCWMCMGSWSEHGANTGGYYKCNRYDPATVPDDDEAGKAKRELDRYLHYYKRYQSHHQAQKFAEKQLQTTERRMIELQETTGGSSWIDVQYLKTANEMVIDCRRTLKYTYTFGYYLTSVKSGEQAEESRKHRELFENMQEDLERYTEVLSELTEKRIEDVDKEGIINNTRVVENFLRNLLAGCEEGLDQVGGQTTGGSYSATAAAASSN